MKTKDKLSVADISAAIAELNEGERARLFAALFPERAFPSAWAFLDDPEEAIYNDLALAFEPNCADRNAELSRALQ